MHTHTHSHQLKTAFRSSHVSNPHLPLSSLSTAYPFTSFDSQPSPDSFSPESATSSEDSRSPLENPLDIDFSDSLDNMADFDYGYPPLSSLSGTFASDSFSASINDRKVHYHQQQRQPQSVHVNSADTDSLTMGGSPCIYPNTSFPVKQEYYTPSVATMTGNYGAYLSSPETQPISVPVSHTHPTHAQQQPTYTYTSSPDSPFLDNATAYYSPPAQLAPMIMASPHTASVSQPHSQVHQPAQPQAVYSTSLPSCDPRFVSGSPPDVNFRPYNATGSGHVHTQTEPGSGFGTGSGITSGHLPSRFMGAFGSPPEVEEAETDDGNNGESELEEDSRNNDMFNEGNDEDEQDEGDDDPADTDYIDASEGRQRLSTSRRAMSVKNRGRRTSRPLIVPSQAARVSALTTPVISSSSSGILAFQNEQQSFSSLSPSSGVSRTQRTARPSAPAPVPVPNLTKKSRGRRVPTHPGILYATHNDDLAPMDGMNLAGSGGSKRARGYTCRVPGCGKCFARGEHLKRHIRSIHTNEKPHKCTHPGCGKEFSRHDNLCQHMRVHRNFSAPRDGGVPVV